MTGYPIDLKQPDLANNYRRVLLDQVVRLDGHSMLGTATISSLADAVMIILLAQRILRSKKTVTSTEIVNGLERSGRVVGRVDFTLRKLVKAGYVWKIGQRRGSRYGLTSTGVAHAQEIARFISCGILECLNGSVSAKHGHSLQ